MSCVLYFDGGCRYGDTVYAFIIYSDETKTNVIHQQSGRCGKGTSNVAEYRALLFGLRKSLSLGIKKINIYGDSLVVINQINGKFRTNSDHLRKINNIIVDLLNQFDEYIIKWVKRSKNRDTDRLVREVIKKRWPKKSK